MKNFKVIIKTDKKHCPFKYIPYHARKKPFCSENDYKQCTEKNCPFKERQ